MISNDKPLTFISICMAVIPFSVPATLKSISPLKSSKPIMSDRIAVLPSSIISPMAIPATGAKIGTPASIKAKVEPQVLAIEVEPLPDMISETTLIV